MKKRLVSRPLSPTAHIIGGDQPWATRCDGWRRSRFRLAGSRETGGRIGLPWMCVLWRKQAEKTEASRGRESRSFVGQAPVGVAADFDSIPYLCRFSILH